MLDWAVSAREINRPASGEDRQRDSGVAGDGRSQTTPRKRRRRTVDEAMSHAELRFVSI